MKKILGFFHIFGHNTLTTRAAPTFFTYSGSLQPYLSKGVSYSPNPGREHPQKWPQSWSGSEKPLQNGDFWGYFRILGPKEAPGGSENIKNGLNTPKYPYFDPSPASVLPLGAKWRLGAFLRCVRQNLAIFGQLWGLISRQPQLS